MTIRINQKYLDLISEDLNKIKDIDFWDRISHQQLPEKFIEKYYNKINWTFISYCNRNLSEQFIEKFQNRVDWLYISCYHKLSEEFIEKFQDKVIWYYVFQEQKLSVKFRIKHQRRFEDD